MDRADNDKIKGLVATIAFHGIIIVMLACAYLYYSYPPKDDELLEPKEEEIFFGGEYVMLSEAVQEVSGGVSGGAMVEDIAKPEPVVTQETESPMKVQPVEKVPEPTAEELAAEAERVRKEKETAAKINKRVSFGNTKGDGGGSTEAPATNAVMRTSNGAPGVSGLKGYTLDSWAEAKSSLNGVVRIKVRVNSRGKVISARYDSGSGSAASSTEVRRNCEQAALKCQFSVPENTTTEGVGVITYNFTPKSN